MGQVDDGPEVRTRPGEVVLAPAPEGDAGTVRFLAEDVAGGATYEVRPWVNSSFGGADIWTRKVLVTVELTPAAD